MHGQKDIRKNEDKSLILKDKFKSPRNVLVPPFREGAHKGGQRSIVTGFLLAVICHVL